MNEEIIGVLLDAIVREEREQFLRLDECMEVLFEAGVDASLIFLVSRSCELRTWDLVLDFLDIPRDTTVELGSDGAGDPAFFCRDFAYEAFSEASSGIDLYREVERVASKRGEWRGVLEAQLERGFV